MQAFVRNRSAGQSGMLTDKICAAMHRDTSSWATCYVLNIAQYSPLTKKKNKKIAQSCKAGGLDPDELAKFMVLRRESRIKLVRF
jgi:hypothetical protein